MSASCDRAIEVEDLILGLDAPGDLEAHVESCADCTEARAMFLAERALFEARPAPATPPLALKQRVNVLRRLGANHLVPAVAAMAACMAAFIGRPPADSCDPPTPVVITAANDEPPAICRAPMSEVAAPAVSLASHDTNACVPSPNATCDVTSSTATP